MMEKIVDALLELPRLKADDTFHFRCDGCGRCCRNRNDILLNPYDLYRVAKTLGMEAKDVVDQYLTCYVGSDSKIPLIAMLMEGEEKLCPLLKDNRCSVHAGKPSVCALFPLGRMLAMDRDTKKCGDVEYFIQDVNCGYRDEAHTVREWLSEFGLEDSEAWFAVWQNAVIQLSEKLIQIYDDIPKNSREMVFGSLFGILYLHYYDQRPFMEQFEENVHVANEFVDVVAHTISEYKHGGQETRT